MGSGCLLVEGHSRSVAEGGKRGTWTEGSRAKNLVLG